jgi:K+-transporting ATPase KdpF subunit
MSAVAFATLIASAGLFIYLVIAMLKPEWFE